MQIMKNINCIVCVWPLIRFEKVIYRQHFLLLYLSLSLFPYAMTVFIDALSSYTAKILPQNCMDLVKPDPGLIQSNPEPIVYRCRKCRRIVAAKSNCITHTPVAIKIQNSTKTSTQAEVHAQPNQSKTLTEQFNAQACINTSNHSDRSLESVAQPRCKEIIFVEPLIWMHDIAKQTQGKLNCPKCQSKLGNFTWINSCNCPCGKNISPAFYLVPSKVELTHTVQNVEITV